MRWVISIALLLAGGVLGIGIGAGVGATALVAGDPPRGDTIVSVTGSRADGFEIRHYDGSEEFPPTDSEARAECGEYDGRVDRVRCRTEVRTWYRDLGDLKRALRWAHAS